jgi:proteic killer suppression protein
MAFSRPLTFGAEVYMVNSMKIEFRDKRMALILTEKAHELGLPPAVIKACRSKLVFLDAAPDELSIRNWKSLQYKKLEGDKHGRRTVRINDQYRIVFTIDEDTNPPTIVIWEIGDPH